MSSLGESSPFPVTAASVEVAPKLSASPSPLLAAAPVDGLSHEETSGSRGRITDLPRIDHEVHIPTTEFERRLQTWESIAGRVIDNADDFPGPGWDALKSRLRNDGRILGAEHRRVR